MTDEKNTTAMCPETWSEEFIAAAAALHCIVEAQGLSAPFLPENAHFIRAAAKHVPPELFDETQEWLRQLNYSEASSSMKRIAAEYGDEALALTENADLLIKMMLNAPSVLMKAMEEEAQAMNLLPPTTHVDANGQPVYSLEQVATKLGVSVQELEEPLSRMRDQECAAHTGIVFPVQ